ncbi:MAG: type II secretion system major pseudopilin GspG [bacterium]|nr:type II secretion system major pseudopilin GspG [bacterium]
MRKKRLCYFPHGFTLMEIMLVVVIIAILAGFIIPNAVKQLPGVKIDRTKADIVNISNVIDLYYMHNGNYPTTDQGLQALIEKPTSAPIPKDWRGPYLKKKQVPVDPWGNEYKYKCPGDHNPEEYDIWSMGPDGQDGSEDDIGNWEKPEKK